MQPNLIIEVSDTTKYHSYPTARRTKNYCSFC